MRPTPEKPKTQERANNEDLRRTHPAFGMIGASRFTSSGEGFTLYGSPIKHHAGITLRIVPSLEWVSDTGVRQMGDTTPYVEVVLSEAQWAAFVSTLNVGSGVPCTVTWKPRIEGGHEVPAIEDEHPGERADAMIRKKVARDLTQLREATANLKALIDRGGRPNKAELDKVYSKLLQSVENAPSNYAFAGRLVEEHADKTVTAAKAEVSSFITQMAMQYPALANVAPELPKLEHKKEKGDGG